jgi:hypothetical protein
MKNYFNSVTELCKTMQVQFEFVGYKFLTPHFIWGVENGSEITHQPAPDITSMIEDLTRKIEKTIMEITDESN